MTLGEMSELESALGVTFRDPLLLECALTHRSWVNDHENHQEKKAAHTQQHNERLEYLGDAILDFIVAELLYCHFPEFSEGDLTLVRAALVKAETLARLAQKLDLAHYVRLSRGEEAQGGRSRATLLASAFEAMLGAIYLDQGLDAAWQAALRVITPEIEGMKKNGEKRDAKSVLQEWAQDEWQAQPRYQVVETNGPEHARTFVVEVWIGDTKWGRGEGRNKRLAEQAAAQNALEALNLVCA